jgi:hypothetical protein
MGPRRDGRERFFDGEFRVVQSRCSIHLHIKKRATPQAGERAAIRALYAVYAVEAFAMLV